MIEINNKKLCESCFAETNQKICPKCGFDKSEYASDPLVLPMGTKLNGKIVIGRVMGKGGFGVTYLGYDMRMDKIIAVKEYYPNGIAYRAPSGTEVSLADAKSAETFEKGAEKFYTEAQMVAQFNGNPNIVSVYDYFRANNTVYLIMEYLSGITLKTYVKKHGKLTDGQALFVMDKIAAALSITHSAGVLHRDISPDNIMICADGKVKLIDFGAARQIMAESSSNLTVVMKPGYTPIEQYTKKGRQGAWTDIYSLGVSIYYALTEVIIDDPYARMDSDDEFAENRHGINGDLWSIIKKCTMINASDRYGNAIELRKALTSVSAPIKSEPLVLTDDDLKSEDSAEQPVGTSEQSAEDFPVTRAAAEEPEEIEVFEDTASEPVPIPADEETEAVSEDVPDRKKSGGKKFIIGGISAAAVLAVLICGIALSGNRSGDIVREPDSSAAAGTSDTVGETTAPETESAKKETAEKTTEPSPAAPEKMNRTVELDNHDMVWGLTKSISRSVLNGFDGDIRVTLKTKHVTVQKNEDGNYYHVLRIMSDGGRNLEIKAPVLVKDEYYNFPVDEDGMDFVFVIPKFFAEHVTDKIYFETENVMIDTAIVEADTYDKEIEFDGEYPGDWQVANDAIPISELNGYDGGVRVTLDLEVGKLENGENLFIDEKPLSFIQPIGDDWFKLEVTADNLKYPSKDEMYMLVGEGERQFSFTVSQDELERFCKDGLKFQVYNLEVKKAYIKGLPTDIAE